MQKLESNALFVSNMNISLAREVKNLCRDNSVNVINCESITKLLSEFVKTRPSLIFFDFVKPIDGAKMLINNFLHHGFYEISYLIFVVNDETNDSFEDIMELENAKEKIVIVHEYDLESIQYILHNIMFSVIEQRGKQLDFNEIDRAIINLLNNVKINKKHKGYRMLKDAVKMVCLNNGIVECLFKVIYPAIAANNNTSYYSVERNIRTALRYIYNSTSQENLKKTFGNNIDLSKQITNLEAITTLSENVMCEISIM